MEDKVGMIKAALEHVPTWVPFLGMAVTKGEFHAPIVTRLIEATILGGVVMYGTTQVLGEKISAVEKQVSKIEVKQESIRQDITDIKVDIARIKK